MKRVVTVGDNCIDYYENEKKGYPGGNPVNVAVYLKRMGYHASYVGVVGTDEFGTLMIDSISNKGVEVSHVRKEEGTTAMTMVTFEGNDRILGDYYEGVLENFHLTKEDLDYINTFDLMVTGIWSKIENNLDQIKIPVVFDFADKYGTPLFDQSIHKVEYPFFSYDDCSLDELKEIVLSIYGGNNQIMVVTRGSKGSLAYDGKQFYEYGIIPCDVVDTLGAGDSYIAGFIQAMLEGKEIIQCMENGAKQATITIQYQGAW